MCQEASAKGCFCACSLCYLSANRVAALPLVASVLMFIVCISAFHAMQVPDTFWVCFVSLRATVYWYRTLHCAQINCDGEPMRDTHFSFKVLPQRLRLHMPQPKLLRQPSRVLNTAQQEYHSKINSQLERPARKPRQTLLRHPILQSFLTNGLVLGMGVALTLGVQRFQQRMRSDA